MKRNLKKYRKISGFKDINQKNVEYVDVVPVFVVVLGSDAKKLRQWIGKLGIKIRIALQN